MFIVEDNILWHLGGPYNHTDSHENWFHGCKIVVITHTKPCNGYSFSLIFFDVRHFNNIHEFANEIIFIKANDINKFVS